MTDSENGLWVRIYFGREPLLKSKAQYSWPSYTNYFRLAAFDTENIIYFFSEQTTL
jgi:hypothetical protein